MHDIVLCVDDDPITLLLIKKVASKIAFAKEIITAKSGYDAMDYFEKLLPTTLTNQSMYPKIILLDLNMPIMGGWEFLDSFAKKELQVFFKNTRVFILSSSIDPKDIARAKTYPIVIDFISKPITVDKIESLMQQLLLQ